MQSTSSSQDVEALELFTRVNADIRLVEATLNRLFENYSRNLPIVLLVVAGSTGNGKSTWANVLMHLGLRGTNYNRQYFVARSADCAVTKGIHVLSHPLRFENAPGVQFMLIDLEGMDGIIPDEDPEVTRAVLKKLYMIGMMLASVFTIHSGNRADDNMIRNLNVAGEIFLRLQREIQLVMPKIYVLKMDAPPTQDGTQCNLRTILQTRLTQPQILDSITFKGRGFYKQSFLQSNRSGNAREALTTLDGTSEAEGVIHEFVHTCQTSPKLALGSTATMTMEQFSSYVRRILAIVNSNDLKVIFQDTVESMLRAIAKSISADVMAAFTLEVLNTSRENENLAAIKTEFVERFDSRVRSEVRSELQKHQIIVEERSNYVTYLDGKLNEIELRKPRDHSFQTISVPEYDYRHNGAWSGGVFGRGHLCCGKRCGTFRCPHSNCQCTHYTIVSRTVTTCTRCGLAPNGEKCKA